MTVIAPITQEPTETITPPSIRSDNTAVRTLLAEWLADDSGYDEQVWPLVKTAIEESRLSN